MDLRRLELFITRTSAPPAISVGGIRTSLVDFEAWARTAGRLAAKISS